MKRVMKKKLIVLGGGGHAKVVVDLIQQLDCFEVLGIVDVDKNKIGSSILGVDIMGSDEMLSEFPPKEVCLANGIGAVGSDSLHGKIFEKFSRRGYQFPVLSHPSAIVSSSVVMHEGVQIMAGSVVQAGVIVHKNAIINTRASVDHDCVIGSSVHIAPGVVLSGGVHIGANVHIGTGAVVIENIYIGESSLVGAGSVVICDVPSFVRVVGVPAKELI